MLLKFAIYWSFDDEMSLKVKAIKDKLLVASKYAIENIV